MLYCNVSVRLFSNHVMLKKQSYRIAMLMIIVILTTIFFHSGHYSKVEINETSSSVQHECFLCHQGIDFSPPKISLAFVSTRISRLLITKIFSFNFVLPPYVLALLRAPPCIS